jgi:5-methylcytosine-specific restriction endonuclease McrA
MRWSERVLERDKVCVCGSPAEEAHHIYPKALYPELRTLRENGIGLCKACHKAVYGEETLHIERFLQGRPLQARRVGHVLAGAMRARLAKYAAQGLQRR